MTFTHVRCGGTLTAEKHRRWTLDVQGEYRLNTPVLGDQLEVLHRCDRCGHIGVAVKPRKNPAR